MNKKIFFILGLVTLLVIFLLYVILNFTKKSPVQENQPAKENTQIPPLQTKANPQNVQEVRKTVESIPQSPIPEKVRQEGTELIKFNDGNGRAIPLVDFEEATDVAINPQLRNYLDSKDYRMFYCPGENNGKDFGVYLGYNVGQAYVGIYSDTIAWLKDWEKTMLRDLHPVLFPGLVFSDEDLNRGLQFRDGKFRYAEIKLPDGKTSSINYRVSDNGVIITTSLSCMEKLVEIYEPLQP